MGVDTCIRQAYLQPPSSAPDGGAILRSRIIWTGNEEMRTVCNVSCTAHRTRRFSCAPYFAADEKSICGVMKCAERQELELGPCSQALNRPLWQQVRICTNVWNSACFTGDFLPRIDFSGPRPLGNVFWLAVSKPQIHSLIFWTLTFDSPPFCKNPDTLGGMLR